MSHVQSRRPRGTAGPASPPLVASLLLVAMSLLVAGCGRHDRMLAPEGRDAGLDRSSPVPIADLGPSYTFGTYPLRVGNRWHYTERILDDVLEDPLPPREFRYPFEVEQIQTERIGDRDYVVEEERVLDPRNPRPVVSWWRYRGDPSGLFMADLPGDLPPGGDAGADLVKSSSGVVLSALARMADGLVARFAQQGLRPPPRLIALRGLGPGTAIRPPSTGYSRPGGVQEGEITRLRYPLRPGQSWFIRLDPAVWARVEASEVLELPAGRFQGRRIRIVSELFGLRDEVYVWCNQVGLLRLTAHLEFESVDFGGNLIHVVSDLDQSLDGFDLVRAVVGS